MLTSSVSPMLGWLELLVQHNNTCQVISVAYKFTQGCFTVSVKRNWKDEIALGFFLFYCPKLLEKNLRHKAWKSRVISLPLQMNS